MSPSFEPLYTDGLDLESLLAIRGSRPLAIASEMTSAKRLSFSSAADKAEGWAVRGSMVGSLRVGSLPFE